MPLVVEILRANLYRVAISNNDGKIDIFRASSAYMDINSIKMDKAILNDNKALNKPVGIGIIIIITIAIIPKATVISPNFILLPPNNYL